MAQISQQDNLYIESAQAATALEGEVKNKLIECIKGGTIQDVVLTVVPAANVKMQCKIVSVTVDTTTAETPKYAIGIADINAASPAVTKIALN